MVGYTDWYCLNKDGEWKFNHRQYGICVSDVPVPVSELQKRSWQGKIWRSEINRKLRGDEKSL